MQSAIRNSVLRPSQSAIAILAAAIVLLAAWVLPLPRLVLSEEEDAATRMPQTRADVAQARAEFERAQASYKGYVANHDVGAALDDLARVVEVGAVSPDPQKSSQPVIDYLSQLQSYAKAGEAYFDQLKHFDDELMAWTRSLGAGSESLRADTWPIVEYLKLYPPPTGLKADYTGIAASDVGELVAILEKSGPNTNPGTYRQVISDVRAAGRSLEYTESLHAGYETLLQDYHTRLQAVASGTGTGDLSGSRTLFAYAVNVLLGLLLLAGLAALFVSRRTVERELAS
ncbi:MAG: hypothetical protein WCD37_01775 [Chloroflexia bacterium]